MLARKDLKVGGRYTYKHKGMPKPVVLTVEKIDDYTVYARDEESKAARRWVIETFLLGCGWASSG